MAQPREGQAHYLPKSAAPERATHVAVQKQHGHKYFCWLDTSEKHGQEGVPDDEVPGTYWTLPCDLYGSCYNGASLWQGGFDFIPLDEWTEGEDTPEKITGRSLGLSQDPPPDLPVIVASIEDGMIVWSRDGGTHQVRYGLQTTTFVEQTDDPTDTQCAAATDFGLCVRHFAECEGRLDTSE
jgi:hypothetical protein